MPGITQRTEEKPTSTYLFDKDSFAFMNKKAQLLHTSELLLAGMLTHSGAPGPHFKEVMVETSIEMAKDLIARIEKEAM